STRVTVECNHPFGWDNITAGCFRGFCMVFINPSSVATRFELEAIAASYRQVNWEVSRNQFGEPILLIPIDSFSYHIAPGQLIYALDGTHGNRNELDLNAGINPSY